MYGGRFTTGPQPVVRKKTEGKPSMLPKPRRTASTERASMDARRPSSSHRSSSAEPARSTLAPPGRLSREASASKLPINRRSRSQQDRHGQAAVTPLRSNIYSRTTTTPQRTPSEDRQSRNWATSLDRALAFITIKDQRPISNMAWQRAEFNRVLECLGGRGAGGGGAGGGGQPALTRPLTITRFVDVCNELLQAIVKRDHKLNNDNYILKLPNLAKRFLYPGAISKSWLKAVNTLHAFPHALAFISYFLDLVNHIETPVCDDWLYAEKDELAQLRRDFLHKSYIRFQVDNAEFDDLVSEYLQGLKQLLGHDEGQLQQLETTIQQCQATLEDESELAARAEEERVRARREALAGRVRAARAERRQTRASADTQRARQHDQHAALRALDADINNIMAELQEHKRALETQTMSVGERARLLDEVDYATRVADSKRTLAAQVHKLLVSKETELAGWQKRTLDSCVEYKQALIRLAARCPPLAHLAIDEQELMSARCAEAVGRAVETLRAHAQQLAERRAHSARLRDEHCRQQEMQLEECRKQISELQATIARSQQALEAELEREAAEAAAWARRRDELDARVAGYHASEDEHARARAELEYWEQQDKAWTSKLAEMQSYIASLRAHAAEALASARRERARAVVEAVGAWGRALDAAEAEERDHAPPATTACGNGK